MISRKKFLHLAGLGIASSLAPNFLFAKFLNHEQAADDVPALLKAARRLRKQGRLNAAKTKYEQALALDTSEVRAYNGIRKILLAKKNKELQVIQLYQQAISNLPNNVRFRQRLLNQYANAALGNKKILTQLNIPSSRPLLYVKEKYEEMLLQNCPNQKNIQKELAKINKYIALNVDTSDVRKNKELKKYRRETRNTHKKRFDHLTAQESTVALTTLKAKEASVDRAPQIREMSKVNVFALRKEKDYTGALAASQTYLDTIDKSDPYFIKQFRELSKQLDNYDDLLAFEQYNHSKKNTFWSGIALFDAHFKKNDLQNISGSALMDTLILTLKQRSENPQQNFEVATRQAKYFIQKGDLLSARSKLIEICSNKNGISDAHTIDRVNLIIAKYHSKQGNSEGRSQILEIIHNPKKFIEHQDELVSYTGLLNLNRSNSNPLHLQQLQKNINNL